MPETKAKKIEIKRESLRELAEKAGINLTNYSIPVVGYERIDYMKWREELQEKEKQDAKKREKQWEAVEEEYFKEHPRHRWLHPGRGYDAAYEKFGVKYDFKMVRTVDVQRAFLWGKGFSRHLWIEPLSRGVLLSLAQAQETKQFERFEVWRPVIGVDPVLVGFTGWNDSWNPSTAGFGLYDCKVTYLICAWE